MKKTILSGILLLLVLVSNGQNRQTELEKAVFEILELIHNKDWAAINNTYINANNGVYLFFRMGAYPAYAQLHKIEEAVEVSPNIFSTDTIFHDFNKKDIPSKLIKKRLNYTCDEPLGWDNEGLFIEKRKNYPLMTETMNLHVYADLGEYSKADFEKALSIEKNCVRIVFTKADIILHLKRIENRWYILFIDQSTPSCDA